MKFLASVWAFIAGDSKLGPLAVALALAVAVALRHSPVESIVAGAAFAAIVALGLAASVFEQPT